MKKQNENKEECDFDKQYLPFKHHNLPTPVWNEERDTLKYIYFHEVSPLIDYGNKEKQLEIYRNLTDAFADIAYTGFYYPFTSKFVERRKEGRKIVEKLVVKHIHVHNFEEIVKALYDAPKTFCISPDEERFYSKQEINYLRRVQKYLLFIGVEDIERLKVPKRRYRNKLQAKYKNALIRRYTDEEIKRILNESLNFRVVRWYQESIIVPKYRPKECQILVVDKEDNFKAFIELTKEKVDIYKNIKSFYQIENMQDEDKVIIEYFKILEKF